MEFIKPTYEEYCKASEFAKIRYRFGVYIQIIAVILLLFLICYTVINIEEMKANPLVYAEKKLGIQCLPSMNIQMEDYNNNGSYRNIIRIEKE